MEKIVVGTRGSNLSLAQTKIVTDKLAKAFPNIEIETRIIKTHGDINKDMKLNRMEQSGVFVKEIDRQLADGEIDIAVHSLKDIPTGQSDSIRIAAIVEREDPRDVLISRNGIKLRDLPKNSRIGTSSLRRKGQLLAFRKDLVVQEMRGNVDSRVAKLDNGEYDAIVLAAAGIKRIGLAYRITEYLPFEMMLPAPGQGALAVTIRSDDERAARLVRRINDPKESAAAECERIVLARIGGGCSVLLGIFAKIESEALNIQARITSEDGKRTYNYNQTGKLDFPEDAGLMLAEKILMSDAADLVGEKRHRSALDGKIIMVTRQEEAGEGLYKLLMERCAIPIYFPTIRIAPVANKRPIQNLESFDMIVITSGNGAAGLAYLAKGHSLKKAKIVAIGNETKKRLEAHGFSVGFMPKTSYSESILEEIGDVRDKKILIVNSERAADRLADELRSKGAAVDRISPYTTKQRKVSIERKKSILGYDFSFITFASPSAVDGLLGILGNKADALLSRSKVVCIGETTAKACTDKGIQTTIISKEHTIEDMVRIMEKSLQ